MVSKIFVCPDGSIPPQIATGNTTAPCVTKVDCIFDLLERANSRCNDVPPGAAQKQRKIQIRVAFKNRHDIDKAQLARSQALMGDGNAARKSYEDFLSLWKDADPDLPVYRTAKAEYAVLRKAVVQ